MSSPILGIHHVTAIASDPQRNLDFYTGVLGLRLVKLTVNFDDPGSYHFYYGDDMGSPGTILTFFAWPGAMPGQRGVGETVALSFSVPPGASIYWQERLRSLGVAATNHQGMLTFSDPDGTVIEIVSTDDQRPNRVGGPVPAEYALRGIHSVTLAERQMDKTHALLTETLGFRQVQTENDRARYEVGAGTSVDVAAKPSGHAGQMGAGTIHHVAWRVADDASQLAWQREITWLGLGVSPVMDRQYFHSIYFREPGGVLFEIATDPPGFTIDESPETLGTHLMLPPQYESQRAQIERHLPPLTLPAS